MWQLATMQILSESKGGACYVQKSRTKALRYQVIFKQLTSVGLHIIYGVATLPR